MQTIRSSDDSPMPAPVPVPAPARGVTRIRHPLKMRTLEVLRAERISPHFVNVVLGGADLAGFVSASFDDHVKLMLPLPLPLPLPGQSEPPEWPTESGRPVMRDYTPRRVDLGSGELHIELALHGVGPAAEWAAAATAGARIGVGGPKGSLIIPIDYDWHLLIGDDSALPAIARRLDELPARAHALVLMQLHDAVDRRPLKSGANVDVRWVAPGETQLSAELRALKLPSGEGFAWAAGEASAIRGVRQVLTDVHGLDKRHIRAAAYWKHGATAHHENLED